MGILRQKCRGNRYLALLATAMILGGCSQSVSAQQQKLNATSRCSDATVLDGLAKSDPGNFTQQDLEFLAKAAVLSEDQDQADEAVELLRAAGQAGLDAMFRVHAAEIANMKFAPPLPLGGPVPRELHPPAQVRLKSALEAIARQYDVHASCLYWETDFEAAKSRAQATGKPILSLRLLGNLDDECSCANSRFFRTALYANQEVAEYLRDNFVLHWKSVRPVPKISIDFGDGRVMERTITGNSIHYVLTPQGDVIDALPGLYSPTAFLKGLTTADEFMHRLLAVDGGNVRSEMLQRYHVDGASTTAAQIRADLNALEELARNGKDDAAEIHQAMVEAAERTKAANAATANNLTATKRAAEAPIMGAMAITDETIEANAKLAGAITEGTWAKIAALHGADVKLDESSIALMRSHAPSAATAAALTVSKALVEDPMVRVVSQFERSIAEDTVRNEYLFHRRIHEWLASSSARPDVDTLNERVYAELFLTPSSDPWLGLLPSGYSALYADGIQPGVPRDAETGEAAKNNEGRQGAGSPNQP